MKELISYIISSLQSENEIMIVTVVNDSGSAPRGSGAKMIVDRNGWLNGTVGGGAIEKRCVELAMGFLKEGKSAFQGFNLSGASKDDLGMICGGAITVFFQYVCADDGNISMFSQISDMLEYNADVWLVTDITGGSDWRMCAYSEKTGKIGMDIANEMLDNLLKTKPVRIETDGHIYYSEPLAQAGRVVIFGGGHITKELVPVISKLGFRVWVFDNRPEFSSIDLFLGAEKAICGSYDKISDYFELTKDDYVIIMTSGHTHDLTVELQTVRRPLAYLGMIGSKSKILACHNKLLSEGVSQQEIDRVYAPIGTKIKAETPAEIAISIAGELIMVRAQRTCSSPH